MVEFRNEPFTDFSKEENKKAFQAALDKVAAELGKDYDLIIGGEHVKTDSKITSINPANKDEVVGTVSKANQELAEKAMNAAIEAFASWKQLTLEERSKYLFRAAAIMRRRKFEFSA